MPAPSITLAITNPGGSGAPPSIDQVPLYVGCAESGTVGTVYTVGSGAAATAILTRGHLLDVVRAAFARGAESVSFIRETGSVPAVISSVTQVGSGGTVAIGGTVSQGFSGKIIMTASGAVGDSSAAKFKYTLDNFSDSGLDPTYSDEIAVPAGLVYTFPGTGMTATFDDDPTALASGDTFTWTTQPPHYGATEIADVTTRMQGPTVPPDITCIVYTGQAATASAANTNAAAINSQINTLFGLAFFFGALLGGGRGTAAEIITATASTVASTPFVGMLYGTGYMSNPSKLVGRGVAAYGAHELAAFRIAESKISTPGGRVASGALPQVSGTDYDARLQGNALYAARIGALRTWQRNLSGGVFLQDIRLLDAPTGDFGSWQDAAVMITALRAVHPVAWLQIEEIYRQNADLTMDARDRVTLKSACDRALDQTLLTPLNVRGFQGHVSAAAATVSQSTQLPAIDVTIAIRRLGVGKFITFTLRYAGEV